MGIYAERRRRLAERAPGLAALLFAGWPRPRNYPANTYPFRASSHFLYFCGLAPPGTVALLAEGRCTLFVRPVSSEEAVWEGPGPSWEELGAGAEAEVRPLQELGGQVGRLDPRLVATLPVLDPVSAHEIRALLGRDPEIEAEESPDGRLARAVVEVRLGHDEAALAELEKAARLSVEAHRAGAWATRPGHGELAVLAAMQAICTAAGASFAFQPIVSVDGHVLHNPHYHGRLQEGDLLLVDLGAETPAGWAGDITRTWPVSGRFSGRQRQIYEIVYEAARQAAARLAPGVRFRDVHLEACRVLALGLVEAGLLRGNADSLVERGAHALFFPHGLGHLVGLDVHDMEDLGDLAGYPPGRQRSPQFGLSYLRLDRDLKAGMLVTIEPGFYWIPALLEDPARTAPFADCLNRDRIQEFREVKGIRIEDEYLVTESGSRCLTESLPRRAAAVEEMVGAPSR